MTLKTQRNILAFILIALLITIFLLFYLSNRKSDYKDFSGEIEYSEAQKKVDDAKRDKGGRFRWGKQTKSVFMDKASFDALTSDTTFIKDPRYVVFNNQSRIQREGLHVYLAQSGEGEETVFLVPGYTIIEGGIEKYYAVDVKSSTSRIKAHNLGDLCPNHCPENKQFYE